MPRLLVGDAMSPHPVTIQVGETLLAAHRAMQVHGFRHLPVLDGDRLVGIVSDRDLALIETLSEVDPAVETVEEAMSADPYAVAPDAPLFEVTRVMATWKYGAVPVVADGRVVGIFSVIDALRVLANVLEAEERPPAASARVASHRAASRPGGRHGTTGS